MSVLTSYPVTQFTPAPSCGIGTSLWAVSKTCYMRAKLGTSYDWTATNNPPFVACTAAELGEPWDKGNRECHLGWWSAVVGDDATTSYYDRCPVGYTTVEEPFRPNNPFYRTQTVTSDGTVTTTLEPATDVRHYYVGCCPSASGIRMTWSADRSSLVPPVRTGGLTYSGEAYLMPQCRAARAPPLIGQTVTLTAYSDTQGWEKRQVQTDGRYTEVWSADRDLWAEAYTFSYLTFADGHKCFDYFLCKSYFESYYTQPPPGSQSNIGPSTPDPVSATTTSSSGAGIVSSTSAPHPGWNGTASASSGPGTGTGSLPSRTCTGGCAPSDTSIPPTRSCPGGCSGPVPTSSGPSNPISTAAAPGATTQRGWAMVGGLVLSVAVAAFAL